ncbi:MAG TPA: response regulator [Bacteroidetes bacterium]|nr:response regulator [Bacteroidota bacterium]
MSKTQFHVLLVEDNQDHVILIKEILNKVKRITRITCIGDGQKAEDFLEKAKSKMDFPNLILLDLKLPCISGFELLKIWKQDYILKQIQTVVLTTSDMEKDKEAAFALGADNYLVKSTNFDILYQEISALTQKQLALQ